jgi:hypothetical protein
MFMKPTVIDIAGTAREFVEWVLAQILFLLGLIAFGLSAPLLFTVGMEILAYRGENMNIWAPIYFILAPFACCIWMVFICHWHTMRQWQRAGKLSTWRQDHGGIFRTVGKAVWFMVAGFFGSIAGEVILLYGVGTIYPDYVNPSAYTLVFAIAPFFVFAPVLLVLLSRWIRRNMHTTV